MEVTEVKVFKAKEGGNLLGFARIVLDGELCIAEIRIVNGKNGPFLGFPENYNKDTKKSYDICFPLTAELRAKISSTVIAKFNEKVQNEKG